MTLSIDENRGIPGPAPPPKYPDSEFHVAATLLRATLKNAPGTAAVVSDA